jgi:hypothetical protein
MPFSRITLIVCNNYDASAPQSPEYADTHRIALLDFTTRTELESGSKDIEEQKSFLEDRRDVQRLPRQRLAIRRGSSFERLLQT